MPHLITPNIFLIACFTIYACSNEDGQKNLVVDQENKDTAAIRKKADQLYDNGDYFNSALQYTKLINSDTSNGFYRFVRAKMYSLQLKVDSAGYDLEKCIQLRYRIADSYFNWGLNYAELDDRKAIILFKKCVEKNPKDYKAKRKIQECEARLANRVSKLPSP